MKNIELKKIVAKSKKYIYGELLGEHSSKQIGDGYDFAKIRAYQYGENIRRVDPLATAKTGEIQLRSFYESRELNVHVIALMSGSLHFGSKVLKQNILAKIVSLIGYSAIKNSDNFTLSMISQKLLFKSRTSKKEANVINSIDKTLHESVIGNKIDYDYLYEYVLKNIKKRSLVFILGDFYEIPRLKALAKKHEIIVVKIRDEFEVEPKELGEIEIIDPVTLQKNEMNFSKGMIAKYKNEIKKYDLKFGEYMKKSRVKQINIVSNQDIYLKFLTSFKAI